LYGQGDHWPDTASDEAPRVSLSNPRHNRPICVAWMQGLHRAPGRAGGLNEIKAAAPLPDAMARHEPGDIARWIPLVFVGVASGA
jgi:hypothetical protein